MLKDDKTASEAFDTRDGFFSYETDLLPDDVFVTDFSKKTNHTYEYDVAVIGTGPAGISAAVKASGLGARVIMFEKDALGGLWLNSGCIPSKTYLYFGKNKEDLKSIISQKNAVISKLTSNTARTLRACRVRVEAGEASLRNAHEIICRGKIYSAAKIILCCGSRIDKSQIPGSGHKGVCTSGDIFKITEVPQRLMVFGGNSEGCEIALAFASLGSNVMLIEPNPGILPGWDKQVAQSAAKILSEAGVKIHTGITVREIGDKGGNPFVVTDRGGVICEKVLLSTGRKPDITALGTLANEIELDGGVITVNEFMETSCAGVFAAGDITGLDLQAQAACKMAETAAINAMGGRTAFDIKAVPAVIYTDPEIASVGLTEEEAEETVGDGLVVGDYTMSSNVRAILSGKTDGFVKVLANRKYGEILGVHIVSTDAAEMIAEPSALMQMEVTIHEVVNDIIHAHPTYGEAFAEACEVALGRFNG